MMNSRVSTWFLISTIVIWSCFSGFVLSAVVTLESIEIFTTHEWIKAKPTVYFMCKGENKTVLPDVKQKHVVYTYKGEESWQPLVELFSKKCKRCGIYEHDLLGKDDVFYEWEFCPSDFTDPDGKYIRFKEKEFNATFSCSQCVPFGEDTNHAKGSNSKGNGRNGMHIFIVILITVLVSIVTILGMMVAYKYWQKKKRAKEQARFLKLFEDGDDIEDELGLGNII